MDTPAEGRSPCPECGSMSRTIQVVLTSTISVKSSVSVTLDNEAPGTSQVAAAEALRVSAMFPEPAIRVEDLPTECVAESLRLVTTLLPPDVDDPDGQWVADVGLEGVQVPLGVGELEDILLAAAEWFSRLVARYEEGRRDEM